MISCQIALYPLATQNFNQVIIDAVEVLKPFENQGLTIEVGVMSTVLKGEDSIVWEAVRKLFDRSSQNGQQIVLNMTVSNECGCDL